MTSSAQFTHHNYNKLFSSVLSMVAIIFLCSSWANAIELKEAQRIAQLYSDQAQIIATTRQVDDAGARQTATFTRPQLNAYAGWNKIDSNSDNPWLPTPQRDLNAGVTASQVIFAGGKIWNSLKLQTSLHQLAMLQQYSNQRELHHQVALAFIDAQRQQQLHDIALDRVQQRQQELDDAQALFNVGSVPQLDVREAQLALQQVENELQATTSDLFVAISTLNNVLGRSPAEKRLTPSGELGKHPSIDKLLYRLNEQIINQQQLDLLNSSLNYTISQQQQQLASGNYWPTVALNASGERQGDHRDEMDKTWILGVQLDWKLYSGGEISAKHAQSVASAKRARALQQQTYKSLLTSCANLEQQHHDLLSQIERQLHTVQLAQANYTDARALYTEGTITMTHLGQYNLAYAENRWQLNQLLYAHNRIYHELKYLLADSSNN